MAVIGNERKFNVGKIGMLKFRCVASRSTKERAEELKRRITRIGTIKVRIVKSQSRAVGVSPSYLIYARPDKNLSWDRLDAAIARLF